MNSNLKVLVLGPSLKAKGGIVSVIKTLAPYYTPFKYITTTRLGNLPLNILTFIVAVVRYLFLLSFTKIDIVHIHTASYNSFKRKAVFIRLAKCFNVKIFVHIHGGNFKRFYQDNKKIVYDVLNDDKVYIIALSDSWKLFFEDIFDSTRVHVLNNPIQKPIKLDGVRQQSNKVRFLFVGKICKEKGCYDLLEAISKIREQVCKVAEFHLAGVGDVERFNVEIESRGLNQIIKCIGWVDGVEKQMEYSYADYFILPSYVEGVPVSIIEAMSYKLPIITTNVGGIPDVLSPNFGVMLKPGDISSLAKSILAFIEMPESQKKHMGDAAYEVSSHYFTSAVIENLAHIYLNAYN